MGLEFTPPPDLRANGTEFLNGELLEYLLRYYGTVPATLNHDRVPSNTAGTSPPLLSLPSLLCRLAAYSNLRTSDAGPLVSHLGSFAIVFAQFSRFSRPAFAQPPCSGAVL